MEFLDYIALNLDPTVSEKTSLRRQATILRYSGAAAGYYRSVSS